MNPAPLPIIECIPNFSEGRDAALIARLADAVRAIAGVRLLDIHRDDAHHRSVLTCVGPPGAIVEAAVAAARRSSECIDLRKHRGAHPRMGAADVIPFVPLVGATLDVCVALARDCGRRIGDELGIPVYLYEAAATRPERRNLADLRRPQFEGLRDLIGADPAWAPDYGPAELHPTAGATAVGARGPLIAYNVWLDTADVAAAKAIAGAVRERDGGLPGVKALGLYIAESRRVQISMNLCDPERTSMRQAFEAVAREAERRGIGVSHSELVGMVPARHFDLSWVAALQLKDFRDAQVIEHNVSMKSR